MIIAICITVTVNVAMICVYKAYKVKHICKLSEVNPHIDNEFLKAELDLEDLDED